MNQENLSSHDFEKEEKDEMEEMKAIKDIFMLLDDQNDKYLQ